MYANYSKEEKNDDDDDAIELHAVDPVSANLRFWHQEARTWKPAGGASLSVRCFEGEFVVYNPLSGHTHYLDIVSGQVLMLIAAGVCGTNAICSRIAAFLEVDSDDQVAAIVYQTLEKLEVVRLIEPDAR